METSDPVELSVRTTIEGSPVVWEDEKLGVKGIGYGFKNYVKNTKIY